MFACHGCGKCCQHVDAALAGAAALPLGSVLHEAGAAFPYPVNPDGSCSQLQADMSCGKYAERPLFCSVDRLFDALDLPGVSLDQWYALNAAHCPPT
jgi:Fe-S-cluster containining protein